MKKFCLTDLTGLMDVCHSVQPLGEEIIISYNFMQYG